jgi:CRISPR-associated protein Csy1
VLFRAQRPGATRVLRERIGDALRAVGAEPEAQLVLLPMTDRSRFLAICAACDVMVDTPHWSGGNTTLDALTCGLPVVTVPGAMMRGRQSFGMLRQLGLHELIATQAQEQADLATAIAGDPPRRRAIVRQIGDRLPALLSGSDALSALTSTIECVLDKSPHAAGP